MCEYPLFGDTKWYFRVTFNNADVSSTLFWCFVVVFVVILTCHLGFLTSYSKIYTNLNNVPLLVSYKGFLSIQIELFEEINASLFGVVGPFCSTLSRHGNKLD